MEEEMSHMKNPTVKERRGFWALVLIQAQNAFNEKAAQFLLIPLGAWLWGEHGSLEYFLGAVIVLPYLLFSPFVGWLADCFCKTRIIQFMGFLQIFVMAAMWYCLTNHNIIGAIFWFCIFAVQATVLSPAKKGIVKDMMGSKRLGFCSGIMEMSSVFALLAAQIGVFIWYDELLASCGGDGWHAAAFPTFIFMCAALPVAIASLFIPRYKSSQTRKFSFKLFYEHFFQLRSLFKDRKLRLSEIGISYFWFLAGSLILITIQIAKAATSGGVGFGMSGAILMAWLSGGVILGGVSASILCRRNIELGLIPLGAIGMTISCICLTIFAPLTLANNISFFVTGAFAAAYLVPLNAYLQDNCDPAQRGNIIAAGNLMDCGMGLVAVCGQFCLNLWVDIYVQFLLLSITSLFITVVSLRLIPREFIRMLGLWLMSLCYRPRIIHADNIPEYGGVLLVSNHVTFGDALFLTLISPRPIRFIVAEEFVTVRFLGWVLEIFNTLPISSKNPREALAKAAAGLRDGEVICIFPEGQLTRTGCICPIRRGLEVIARRAKTPILPIYLDQLWGSIFSFSENRFFSKIPKSIPYSFTAAVGTPITATEITTELLLQNFRKLSADCIALSSTIGREELLEQLEKRGNHPLVFAKDQTLTGIQIAACIINNRPTSSVKGLAALWIQKLLNAIQDPHQFSSLWINAQQLTRVNALQAGYPILTTIGHDEPHELVASIFWPILTKTPVYLISNKDDVPPPNIKQVIGSQAMRKLLLSIIPPRQVPFFDFSGAPDFSTPNTRWRPCYATSNGIIIAMSMTRSVFKVDDGTVQLGMRPRTRGRIIPGFYLQEGTKDTIMGPSLSSPHRLDPFIYLDEVGFFAELNTHQRH